MIIHSKCHKYISIFELNRQIIVNGMPNIFSQGCVNTFIDGGALWKLCVTGETSLYRKILII